MRVWSSLTSRILGTTIPILLLLGLAVFTLSRRALINQVEASHRDVYLARMQGNLRLLERAEQRLEATGRAEVYRQQFQESALRTLEAVGRTQPSDPELVVFDSGGAVILPAGIDAAPFLPFRFAGTSQPSELVTTAGDDGPPRHGIFVPFRPWNWSLGYVIPDDVFFADVRLFQFRFLLILALALGGSHLAIVLAVRFLTRPIVHLTRAASAMAAGDLDAPIPREGSLEVALLAEAFTQLRETILRKMGDLERQNEDLVREVTERQRAEESLERQNEDLKAMDRVKDGLVRDVSHELKTPVAKIRMQMELLERFLRERGLRGEAGDTLQAVDRSLARLEGTIRNILDLAQLEGGKRRYHREPLEVDQLLDEVLADFGDLLLRHRFQVTRSAGGGIVFGDRQMLRHVLANLVDNSLKYRSPRQPRSLTLASRPMGETVEVTVADDGMGMTAEVRQHAFERFYQGSPASEGSGVGLAICRSIVRDHGGEIGLASPGPGQGTVVTLRLPSAPSGASSAAAPSAPTTEGGG
jgi:signal transduction histidine kinase